MLNTLHFKKISVRVCFLSCSLKNVLLASSETLFYILLLFVVQIVAS